MLRPGDVFGDYQVVKMLGQSNATVFEVWNNKVKREEALKILADADSLDPRLVARFNDDASLAGKVRHPNVVIIYQVGQDQGVPYFTMELLRGESLDKQLERGEFPTPAEAAAILKQTASALDAAHAAGVVHRDVKPGNILVMGSGSDIKVKVIDFGIARDMERLTRKTAEGAIMGTLAYISPEAAKGTDIANRADQYSLAVIAYQLLCHHVPFEGRPGVAAANAHAYEPPPDPSKYGVVKHARLALIRALSKSPVDRYPTCTNFVEALFKEDAATASGKPTGLVFAIIAAIVGMLCIAAAVLRHHDSYDSEHSYMPVGNAAGLETSGANGGSGTTGSFGSDTGSNMIDNGANNMRLNTSTSGDGSDTGQTGTSSTTSSDPPPGAGSTTSAPPSNAGKSPFDAATDKILAGDTLSDSDISGLSNTDLSYLRNTIYAKRHYIFHGTKNSDRLNSYFKRFDWYHGTDSNEDRVSREISDSPVDTANLAIIKKREGSS